MAASKQFQEMIKSYLDNKANTDEQFAKKYANEKKTIDECCNYIISEVRRLNVTAVAEKEVYGIAVHYYDEEDIKVSEAPNCTVVVPGEKTIKAEVSKPTTSTTTQPATTRKKTKKQEDTNQLSLF